MATMRAKMDTVKAGIQKDLLKAIRNLHRGRQIISGYITVAPGHDYWWFLEYGTGEFHNTPDGELLPPPDIFGQNPEGGPYYIKVSQERLAINPKVRLQYMNKGGGPYKYALAVEHPGIEPVMQSGFVRTSIYEAEQYFRKELGLLLHRKQERGETWPTRERFVEFVNEVLFDMLAKITLRTPDNHDPDPAHTGRHTPLSEAWGMTEAK